MTDYCFFSCVHVLLFDSHIKKIQEFDFEKSLLIEVLIARSKCNRLYFPFQLVDSLEYGTEYTIQK